MSPLSFISPFLFFAAPLVHLRLHRRQPAHRAEALQAVLLQEQEGISAPLQRVSGECTMYILGTTLSILEAMSWHRDRVI